MEFLVMPQLTNSPIECYSADGGNCSPFTCGCNAGAIGCGYHSECSCDGLNCPCYEYDRCPERFCRTYSDCSVRFSWSSTDPTSTI